MPYERDPMGAAHQSFVQSMALANQEVLEIIPANLPSTVVHLARNQMIEWVRNDPSIDYLIMVDSDQVWHPKTIERLVRWGLPCVAPCIIQRLGPALPVAYVHMGLDDNNQHRYNPTPAAYSLGAYMSMFTDARFDGPACILPVAPDHEPKMLEIPPHIREGLSSPLYEVDAVGSGMVCFSGEMIRALPIPDVSHPSNHGGWFDFSQGGEDFSFCRRVKAAGFPVFVDRGLWVGHCTTYVRGPDDMLNMLREMEVQQQTEEAQTAALPPATELAAKLHANGQTTPTARVWESVRLPGEAVAA